MSTLEPQNSKPEQPYRIWQGAHYVLVVLAVVVLVLMFIAWAMPAATPRPQPTPLPGTQLIPTQPPIVIGTPGTAVPVEPTAENVGYANGIIILSALLSLIMLLAVLREVLFFRKKRKQSSHTEE